MVTTLVDDMHQRMECLYGNYSGRRDTQQRMECLYGYYSGRREIRSIGWSVCMVTTLVDDTHQRMECLYGNYSGRRYAAMNGVLVWVLPVVVGCEGFPAQSGRTALCIKGNIHEQR